MLHKRYLTFGAVLRHKPTWRGHREYAAVTSSRLAYRRRPEQQLRQLGDIGGDALLCLVLGQQVRRLGREPFPLMQGQAVAKLAMEASRRHFLHEPRRRPQSTFIVRHLHFLKNRGFGVRNELCSHIRLQPSVL